MKETTSHRRRLIWYGAAILALLHQDYWFWDSPRLVLGTVPVGMAYHILFSLSAAALWALALKLAWPHELEDWAAAGPAADGRERGGRLQ